MKTLLLVIFTISLSACGSKDDTTTTSLSYDFTENGCKTGSHTFSSLAELCTGLQTDALNNGCALGLRQDEFKGRCSGTFTAQ